ncbi:uncharacterized protein LOC110853605 isoform X2 [Folsomia candida]|uniref:uncharacterized protein LOC110853605 isoform X2 n=1 Tax=Folsomia candida TaxID=158441 RepID=UPI0016052199|nr:uncharacterized protein LOC110853605 isoform X2 [Folsomia candida]
MKPRLIRLMWFMIFLLGSGTGFGRGNLKANNAGRQVVVRQEETKSDNFVKLFLCCNDTQNGDKLDKHESNSSLFTPCDKWLNDKTSRIWSVPQNLMSTSVETLFLLEKNVDIDECEDAFTTKLFTHEDQDGLRNWFYPNGYMRVGKEFYAPDEFCIEGSTADHIKIRTCPPKCGHSRPCIPKCCTLDKVYSLGMSDGQRGCHPPSGNPTTYFNPPLYSDAVTKIAPSETKMPHYFLWRKANFMFNCFENKTTLFPLSDTVANNLSSIFNATFHSINFKIRYDGAVLYIDLIDKKCRVEKNPKKVLCFDGVQDYGGDVGFQNQEEEYIAVLCTAWNVEHQKGHGNQIVYGVLLLCASIFPLMTSAVYISLWRKQNVHGWTIAATTGSLFLMYVFQGVALVLNGLNVRETIKTIWGCTFTAIVGHFFWLAAFSWMTVMCCDLWLTFRSLTPANRRSKGRSRYIKYSLFGWGLPTAFVGTGVVLDYYYSMDDCTPHLVPGYGQLNCWIVPNSQGVYNYYPAAVLLCLNCVFFGVTCFKLLKYRENTRIATKRETDHWKGFTRLTKLIIVMGVSWAFDICSWSIDGLTLKWYWMIFDIINILRAVGVFVVYVCKQDIIVQLEDAHPRLKSNNQCLIMEQSEFL